MRRMCGWDDGRAFLPWVPRLACAQIYRPSVKVRHRDDSWTHAPGPAAQVCGVVVERLAAGGLLTLRLEKSPVRPRMGSQVRSTGD